MAVTTRGKKKKRTTTRRKPSGIKSYAPLLRILGSRKLSPAVRKSLINSPKVITVLSQCAYNTLSGRVKLSPARKKALRRYKKTLLLLSSGAVSRKRKQKAIEQEGGFLPLLIPPVLGLITGLIGKAVESAIH